MPSKSPVVTGISTLSYPHLLEAHSFPGSDQKPKFSTRILIPKTDKVTIAAINAEVEKTLERSLDRVFGGKMPGNWMHPLKDGDVEYPDDENYAGCFFVNAKSNNRPRVAVKLPEDDFRRPAEHDDVYGGVKAKCGIGFGAYNQAGNRGVSCYLNTVMIVGKGERIGGGGGSLDGDFGEDTDFNSLYE